MLLGLIFLLIVLLGISGFFSASETALLSLPASTLRSFRQDPKPTHKAVATLLKTPQDLLTTLIIINIFITILVQNIVATIFGEYSGWFINVGVPLAITLIFGEILPKSYGLAHNVRIAPKVAPVILKAQNLLSIFRRIAKYLAGSISRAIFFFLRQDKEISISELKHVLTTSSKQGVLSNDEAEIARGFLNLQEYIVKEVMRPREDILFFDIEEDISKLQHLISDLQCSRIPVCKENLDHLLGVITAEIFFLNKGYIHRAADITPFLKKPLFVPESTPATTLLHRMYEKKESFALVVDEYGSLTGLITLEDMVEIVIGEILDLRDEKSRYTKSSEDSIIASGKLELAEFEDIFNVPLVSEHNMVTLGGWITEKLGEIPKAGTKCTTADFLFQILQSDKKSVQRIYVRRLTSGSQNLEEEEDVDS